VNKSAAPAPRSELATRSLVGVALVVAALAAVWLGGVVFWAILSAISLGVFAEWADLSRLDGYRKKMLMLALSVPLVVLGPLAAGPNFLALGLLLGAGGFGWFITGRRDVWLGVVYAGLPVLSLMLIREQPRGFLFAFWVFGLVWLCDIGAYFAGRLVGGPKLARAISPNKTWSGLVGGVCAAAAFGGALHLAAGLPWRLALATPLLALVAQAGDLYESWLKRRAGVKDSGTLLPGHGGLLDRLDGMIAAVPLAALLVVMPQILGWLE
jgi:phosphatidate cytidylyltransferase